MRKNCQTSNHFCGKCLIWPKSRDRTYIPCDIYVINIKHLFFKVKITIFKEILDKASWCFAMLTNTYVATKKWISRKKSRTNILCVLHFTCFMCSRLTFCISWLSNVVPSFILNRLSNDAFLVRLLPRQNKSENYQPTKLSVLFVTKISGEIYLF